MKRGFLVFCLIALTLFSMHLVQATSCFSISREVHQNAGTADDNCQAVSCNETNPLQYAMYDLGSCALIEQTNCECIGNIKESTDCAYTITTKYYNHELIPSLTKTENIREPNCYPNCGECGAYTQQDPTTCLPTEEACKVCTCNKTNSPQCTLTTDLTKISGTCRKCSEAGEVVYSPEGTDCSTEQVTAGKCDKNGNCVESLELCTERENGKVCNQDEYCYGDLIYTPDRIFGDCCIGQCDKIRASCEAEKGKTCKDGRICTNLVRTLDNPNCCLGTCIYEKCETAGGHLCTPQQRCSVAVTATLDNPNCCLGGECQAIPPNTCSELGGTPCDPEKQECEEEPITAPDADLCCKTCVDKGKDTGEMIKWILIIIAIYFIISMISCKGGGMLKGLGGLGGL